MILPSASSAAYAAAARPAAPRMPGAPSGSPPSGLPPLGALARASTPATLSPAERQALAQQFPETPALTQRLYGPARGAASPPPALGTRLDLRG